MTNPYAPPRSMVTDVQDPAGEIVLADRGTRLGAAMLDGVIFGALVYLPLFLMLGAVVPGSAAFASAYARPDSSFGPLVIVVAVWVLAGFVAWCWFTIKYVKANGQSIAKRMLGIKVVRSNGTAVSLSRVFWLRNFLSSLISAVPLFGPLFALADMLFIFAEPRQCLHDKMADTIVVIA
jgi:uncharacterized RDD family membrane protein YckC